MDAAIVQFPVYRDLSVRQLLIMMLFIMPVVALSIIADLGFMKSFSSLLVMLFIGLGIAKKPVKSVLPENSFSYPKRKVQASRARARIIKMIVKRRSVAEAPET